MLFRWIQGLSLVIDLTQPWDSPTNLRPLFRHWGTTDDRPDYNTSAMECPYFLECPSHHVPATSRHRHPPGSSESLDLAQTRLTLAPSHPRAGVFGYDRVTQMQDVTDGASTTMMLAETATASGPWTAGGPATVRGLDPNRQPYIGHAR